MVVSIKDLVNKKLSITTISSKLSNIAHLPSITEMDVDDIIRGKSTSSSKVISRSASIVSNALSYTYHLKIKCNNDLLDDIAIDPIDSS